MDWIKCYIQMKCYYDYSNLHFLITKRLHNILLQTSFLYLASSSCVYPCVCLFNLVIRLFWLLLLTVLKTKFFFITTAQIALSILSIIPRTKLYFEKSCDNFVACFEQKGVLSTVLGSFTFGVGMSLCGAVSK